MDDRRMTTRQGSPRKEFNPNRKEFIPNSFGWRTPGGSLMKIALAVTITIIVPLTAAVIVVLATVP